LIVVMLLIGRASADPPTPPDGFATDASLERAFDYTHLDLQWEENRKPVKSSVSGKGQKLYWKLIAKKNPGEAGAALRAAMEAQGWQVKTPAGTVVIARRVVAGKEQWFSGNTAGGNMNGTYLEVGDPPHPLALKPPGKTIETIADTDDFPYLDHHYGSKLVHTSIERTTINVTAEGQAETLVGPPLVTKLYDLPPGSTPYERMVVYRDALTRAGWAIIRTAVGGDSLVVAHYTKDGRDIFVYLHDRTFSVVDVGAQNEAKALAAQIAKDGHVAIYGIYFDVDKDTLQPQSETALQHVLQLLKSDPKLRVEIQGHTDNTGTAEHNQTLSEARAKSVQKWLVDHGIAASRLVPKGYGDTRPVGDNKQPAGRAQNRRVELQKL